MDRRVALDEVLELAQQLSSVEKVMLIERIAPRIERELAATQSVPGASLLGVARDLGPAPSADDIDTGRREAWANFPREGDSCSVPARAKTHP